MEGLVKYTNDIQIAKYRGKKILLKTINKKKQYKAEYAIARKLINDTTSNQLVYWSKQRKMLGYKLLSSQWKNLDELLEAKVKLSQQAKINIMRNSRKILEKYHNKYEIAHLDVKTKNIMVTMSGSVKFIDYDLSEDLSKVDGEWDRNAYIFTDYRALVDVCIQIILKYGWESYKETEYSKLSFDKVEAKLMKEFNKIITILLEKSEDYL